MTRGETNAETLEVGALTEWDPLKEVIVGGWDVQWPMITPTERSVFLASLTPESLAKFERSQGTLMEESQPEMYKRVRKEVLDLKAVFESLGVTVRLPRDVTQADIDLYGNESGFLPWFPRDQFITHKNLIIFASLGLPMLQKSQQIYYEILEDKAMSSDVTEMIGAPFPNFTVKEGSKKANNVPLIDGGDVLFFGDKVLVGVSDQLNMGSNLRGVHWLQGVLGDEYEVSAVPLRERFFHLDLVMSAPREGLIMVAPDAYIDGVPSFLDDWDRIEVTDDEAMNGTLNGLPVDPDNYVLGTNARDDMEVHIANMTDKDITVHPVWFDEHNMRDGSIRCATQQLLRVPR